MSLVQTVKLWTRQDYMKKSTDSETHYTIAVTINSTSDILDGVPLMKAVWGARPTHGFHEVVA